MSILSIINTVVAVVGLIILSVYALDTRRIRLAAQEQAEGQHKPCLTLLTRARDGMDVVLEVNNAVGAMVLAAREGNLVVENVGNGVALNVRYAFTETKGEGRLAGVGKGSYLQHIPVATNFAIPVPQKTLRNSECEFVAVYESLGRRRYKSRIQLNNLVITEISFEPLSRRSPFLRAIHRLSKIGVPDEPES